VSNGALCAVIWATHSLLLRAVLQAFTASMALRVQYMESAHNLPTEIVHKVSPSGVQVLSSAAFSTAFVK
jgi:hypothetical protein